ncbi:MAG TPA: glycerol-3-phosphate 1-O-acyltransferase PlsY [Burkholderiales bacterium]|nr:glycerol-3-phosphate 1-O-acyltransferase PlsY [Burkholderiales bacterium]
MLLTFVFILTGYLIGSVSFAVLVSRAMGLPNPHSYGSGNPGATNVLRTGSKKAAVLTLLGDALKGGFALWLAQRIGTTVFDLPQQIQEFTLAGVALAAFLGHLYPVYFGFRGGKGVATAAGILVAMNAGMGAAILGVWLLVALITRYSSLAAITAALAAPAAAAVTFGQSWFTLAVLCMAVLLIWRHRGNISKLRSGTESRIRLKRRDAASLPDGG